MGTEVTQASPASSTSASSDYYWIEHKLCKWAGMDNFGDEVAECAKFIPMKTPMDPAISAQAFGDARQFTVPILIEEQRRRGRRIGLLVDLSNHDSIYTIPADVPVVHGRVVTQAKVPPNPEKVDEFIRVVRSFWMHRPHKHIGVHCSYGLNRTGFMICAYLIEVCRFSVDQAVAAFARARPPGIKHDHFIQELHQRYDPAVLARCTDDIEQLLVKDVSIQSSSVAT